MEKTLRPNGTDSEKISEAAAGAEKKNGKLLVSLSPGLAGYARSLGTDPKTVVRELVEQELSGRALFGMIVKEGAEPDGLLKDKSRHLSLTLRESELEAVRRLAGREHLLASVFVRSMMRLALLRKPFVSEEDRAALGSVAREVSGLRAQISTEAAAGVRLLERINAAFEMSGGKPPEEFLREYPGHLERLSGLEARLEDSEKALRRFSQTLVSRRRLFIAAAPVRGSK